ncbi:response regulator transcription factor [Rugamonas sp. CCM 8940]|nr:response regulator transcription factor [Rugamonas sp. CCM 8940]
MGAGGPISPSIAHQVLARLLLDAERAPRWQPPAEPTPLSSREQEVLTYTSKGFTAQEIARLMDLSPFTVRSFVRRIYRKLEVRSKAEAIYEARTRGLLPD